MKKTLIFGIAFAFFLSLGAPAAHAQYSGAINTLTTIKPFGGRVVATQQPGVTCAAQYGIVNITPIGGIFPPTPYVIGATTKSVTPGGWILGLYNSVLTPGLCYTTTAPPVPYPTFTILKFGASRAPSFLK